MPTHYVPGGGIVLSHPAARSAYAPGAGAVVYDDNAFASQRGDHLGVTLEVRRETLEWWLPQGTTLYAGLFTELPDRTGSGGVEVTVAGYARVAVSRWLTVTIGASARRTNARIVRWPVFAQPVTLLGWGMWSASTGGVLRFFDFLRTSGPSREPVAEIVPSGSDFAIASGAHGIGLVL